MLAQNFKSSDELGISEGHKEALCKTLVLLETDQVVHVHVDSQADDKQGKFTGHFNMSRWNNVQDCGTICCIGGTAEIISGLKFSCNRENVSMHDLFFPRSIERKYWSSITVAQAAQALRNYLTTGDACWQDIK